tara:strand:- start:1926 stop:3113 length:1188 start_codon:yes stop_codon:yes gene_type:complete
MKKIFILLISSSLILNSCKENLKAQTYDVTNTEKIKFIDGEEIEAKYFMDSCIKAFGSTKSKDLCDCVIKDLAKKVTYKEFESDFMMALNFGDNKSQQALNMAQNNHFMKSIEKCMTLYPEALDSPYYNKEKSNEEIEALAQNHLIEIKNEMGREEYNELMKLVDLDNYSICFIKKLFKEFKANEMNKLSIKQQNRVEELRNICLKDNLKETNNSTDNLKKNHKKTDKFVLNQLIEIIKTNDISLFDEIYPSMYNKQDNFIEIGNKTIKVKNRRTSGVSLFGGVAKSLGFYFLDKELIMFESAPADLTFSKTKFDEVIQKSPIYSLIIEQGNMTIHNEYFLYKNIIVNTWRPIKDYEFKNNGVYDDFNYTSDDIYFLTITKKNIFEEMIEPMLKN